MEKREYIEKFIGEEVQTDRICTVRRSATIGDSRDIYIGRKNGIADAILKDYVDSLEEGTIVGFYQISWKLSIGGHAYRYIDPIDFDPAEEEIHENPLFVAW